MEVKKQSQKTVPDGMRCKGEGSHNCEEIV